MPTLSWDTPIPKEDIIPGLSPLPPAIPNTTGELKLPQSGIPPLLFNWQGQVQQQKAKRIVSASTMPAETEKALVLIISSILIIIAISFIRRR